MSHHITVLSGDALANLRPHRLAESFPLMEGLQLERLVESVATGGVHHAGALYDGKVLDGRNRLRAATAAGRSMEFVDYTDVEGFDPVEYVVSINCDLRAMSANQKAIAAAKIANYKVGSNQYAKEGGPNGPPAESNSSAANRFGIAERMVKRAKVVLDLGCPSLIAAVNTNTINVSLAEKLVRHTDDTRVQAGLVKQGTSAIREAVRKPEPPKERQTNFAEYQPLSGDDITDAVGGILASDDDAVIEAIEAMLDRFDDPPQKLRNAIRKFVKKMQGDHKLFVPPTLDEVSEFASELQKRQAPKSYHPSAFTKAPRDAVEFYHHYASEGWRPRGSKTTMTTWKDKFIKWVLQSKDQQETALDRRVESEYTKSDSSLKERRKQVAEERKRLAANA